jgi:hypothetical protein
MPGVRPKILKGYDDVVPKMRATYEGIARIAAPSVETLFISLPRVVELVNVRPSGVNFSALKILSLEGSIGLIFPSWGGRNTVDQHLPSVEQLLLLKLEESDKRCFQNIALRVPNLLHLHISGPLAKCILRETALAYAAEGFSHGSTLPMFPPAPYLPHPFKSTLRSFTIVPGPVRKLHHVNEQLYYKTWDELVKEMVSLQNMQLQLIRL